MPPAHKPRLVLSASDAAKLEDIWKNHALPVRSMLLAFCSNPEDADDALQELFLRLGRNPSVLENTKSPRAFLSVSARRIAIDIARKRAAELRHSESPEAAEMLHPAASSAAPGDDLGAKILEALQSLPPEQRRVAESKLLHGKTLDAIAREEGVPLNTAASRLRYSLDKIRSRLRPIYKAMKNQTDSANKNENPERLIRPLEPKRVPSVVPGLEGAAALASCETQEFIEPAIESPAPETDFAEEPILVVCPPAFFDLPTSEPDLDLFDESLDSSETSAETEETTTVSEEIFHTLFEEETSGSTESEESPIDLGEFVDVEILPEGSEGESSEPDGELEIQPYDPAEFNDYLLGEYKTFLSETPDWIASHSGGDFQAQVMTPSQYVGIDLPNPGEARAFDLWFENAYLSYPEPDPAEGDGTVAEGGSKDSDNFILVGQPRDYGTEIHPEPVYSEGPSFLFNTGVIHFKDGSGEILPYQRSGGEPSLSNGNMPVLGDQHQTVVTGGELAMNQPVEGNFVVEQGAKMTVGEQSFGEGSYEISAEGQIAASPAAANTTAQEAVVQAQVLSGIPAVEVSNTPVIPIVSGSNSVLESPAAERVTFNGESQPDQQDIELPTLIETRNDSSSAEPASTDDIAFIDDAPVIAIQNSEPASGVVAPAAAAQQNIAAAVGGAFVAGSASQVPSVRGVAAKKSSIV